MTEHVYTYCPRPRCYARQGCTVMRGSNACLARLLDGSGGGLINMLRCPGCNDPVHPTAQPPSLAIRARAWLELARDLVRRKPRR